MHKSKFLLSSNAIFIILLFSIPLMNFISNRLGTEINIIVVFFSVILLFIINQVHKVYKINVLFMIILLMLLSMVMSIFYKILFYNYIATSYVLAFYFTYILFFLLILSSKDYSQYIVRHFFNFLNFIIWLSAISIILGHIVLTTELPDTWQLIYRYEANYDYLWRPFGLFGQPSINVGVLLFVYLIRIFVIEFEKKNISNLNKFIYFLLVTVSIYCQKAGSGYIGYILLILFFLNKSFLSFILTSFIYLFVIYFLYIIFQNEIAMFSHKISMDSFIQTYDYFYSILIDSYFSNITFLDLIFGIDDSLEIAIDFGPIYILAHFGILYCLILTFIISYIVLLAKNKYIAYAFILLFLLSLHYPIVIYPLPSFIYLMLIVYLKDTRSTQT